MRSGQIRLGWWTVLACALCVTSAGAQEKSWRWSSSMLPLDQIPETMRDRLKNVVDRPTIYTHGPAEEFGCRLSLYFWLLDHPDRAIQAWRKLGARCMDIQDLGNGRFGCYDPSGNEVHWDTAYRSPDLRIWYAEGNVRPAPMLPSVTVRAVIVLRHIDAVDETGKPVLRHQADMMLYTDNKTAALATKLMGSSAPRMAEQYVGQLERFFSALSVYLQQHPDKCESLLAATNR